VTRRDLSDDFRNLTAEQAQSVQKLIESGAAATSKEAAAATGRIPPADRE